MKKIIALLLSSFLLLSFAGCSQNGKVVPVEPDNGTADSGADGGKEDAGSTIIYNNTEYGFDFTLPEAWKDYTIIEETWQSSNPDIKESGPEIVIRSPLWTEKEPYQDIPILIFSKDQWTKILKEEFNVSAAPIPPSLLGENSTYVFALPPRYNFAYPKGYEDVEKILQNNPLAETQPGGSGSEQKTDN